MDINKINKQIETIKKEESKQINTVKAMAGLNLDMLEKRKELLKKYSKKKEITKDDLKDIFSLLCFRHLSYCCGINKSCDNRDIVLELLGVDKKRFKEIKENIDWLKQSGGNNGKV